MKATLKITLEYNLDDPVDVPENYKVQVEEMLADVVQHAADQGLLTGTTPLEVTALEHRVTVGDNAIGAWAVMYSHKYGNDVWVEWSEKEPNIDGIIASLRKDGVWDEDDDDRGSCIEIFGPFKKEP